MNLDHYEKRAAHLEKMAASLQESDLKKLKLTRLANKARRAASLMALRFRQTAEKKPEPSKE